MSEIKSFLDIKYESSSRIFESEEIQGCTPDQIIKAEELYKKIYEEIKDGKEISEGIFGSLIGGTVGALAGPALGRALCAALGIDEKGVLGSLLTSRLVLGAIGAKLGGR